MQTPTWSGTATAPFTATSRNGKDLVQLIKTGHRALRAAVKSKYKKVTTHDIKRAITKNVSGVWSHTTNKLNSHSFQ